MIRITVETKHKTYYRVTSEGHADYADEGYDIICAAVSVLCVTAVNSIDSFTTDRIEAMQDDGFVSFTLPDGCSKESDLLIRSMLLGLNDIREAYGNQYLEIIFEEVQVPC